MSDQVKEEEQAPAASAVDKDDKDSARLAAARSDASAAAQIEDTENFIEAYHAVAEWIRFADAKAGVVLTVGGALAGLLVPTVREIIVAPAGDHLFPQWKAVVLGLFALFILFLLLSGIAAFRCIAPFRRRRRHPSLGHCAHFHPAAVAHKYRIDQVDDFVHDCEEAGVAQFRREVIAALLFASHISNAKYQRVGRSIQLFAVSAMFAFLYLLAIQL